MQSIKKRLVGNFMLVILITVLILETLLINAVTRYYYANVEEILTNQIKVSSEFYSRYFSNESLQDILIDNVDVFWKQTSAQVQILDLSGNVLMDSLGVIPKNTLDTADYKKALKGEQGRWIGKVSYDSSPVMAVSYPLKSDDKIIGIIRFVTSLSVVNNTIKKVSLILIGIGIIVIFISGTVSLLLSQSIIEPLKELTETALKMASGNLRVRNKKKYDDEIGKLSDTLNYMAEEILKKDQLKNEFISSVSHELRTPLTSIKGWAITLNSENLDDKALIKDGLTIIEKESDRLTYMVEELLDFSKFVSGKVTLKKEKTNFISTIEYIKIQLSPRAVRDTINFNVEYDQNLPLIDLDENRIKQVLINLLDNAFKFTPEYGTVTFSTKIINSNLVMCIEDTGSGISKDELPKVKEKFYKGKSSKSKNGIGLSICDEIINLHNGQFIIESELNKGTKVSVILPIE